jgi:hypothetical protein
MIEVFAVYNNGFSVPLDHDIIDADLASRRGPHVEFFKNGRMIKEIELQPQQHVVRIPGTLNPNV